jgi:DNA-binding CsgD family transcriptional regulator
MASTPSIRYQWQNPNLRKTIYPFREKKLRDFLLYYYEIDLCKKMLTATVDPRLAAELLQEINRVETDLSLSKIKKQETDTALKALQAKHRETLRSIKVRQLAQRKINLEIKISGLTSTKKRLERQVDWYRQFAPEHPYYDKWSRDLQAVKEPYQAAQTELAAVMVEYNKELAPFETEAKTLQAKGEELRAKIRELSDELKRFPRLDSSGAVNSKAAVRWLVLKHERDLMAKSHDELLADILQRFDSEPQRFPKWLQYMVVHFSGMRYKSAHGSWADPNVLLEAIRMEEVKEQVQQALGAELDKACSLAINDLQKKKQIAIPTEQRPLDIQLIALSNPVTRKTALLKYRTAQVVGEVQKLSEQQVLDALKIRKGQMPDWAWKEIASRTELRLEEAKDENWEELTYQERQERWKYENERWRQIMDFWERKDITGWRKEHELTLQLVVTRAVCNEIAEHIQHLRGNKPGAGLTAKPAWYINAQRKDPARAYFKRPTSAADFKSGASILWLGWVDRMPNPWQIARPLEGFELVPSSNRPAMVNKRSAAKGSNPQWNYSGASSSFTRSAQIQVAKAVPGNKKKVKTVNQPVSQWLRWTHEATVISVERMGDGRDYVLTFETGQIGVILRPLSHLVNSWDVFVGYVPPAPFEPPGLDKMIDRASILPTLPKAAPPAVHPLAAGAPGPGVAFGLPGEDELAFGQPFEAEEKVTEEQLASTRAERAATLDALARWGALTPRQRQVVALICQEGTTRQVATKLDTSVSNVRSHLSNAMGRLGVHNRDALCEALGQLDFSMWLED